MLLSAGNANVRKLLAGDVAGLPVAKIGVGTSDTAVSESDSTLTGAVIVDVEEVTYPTAKTVKFRSTLADSVPAMTIKEIGLYDENEVLLHRKVVPDTAKADGVEMTLYYTIPVK